MNIETHKKVVNAICATPKATSVAADSTIKLTQQQAIVDKFRERRIANKLKAQNPHGPEL
jgi:hypothetical protein